MNVLTYPFIRFFDRIQDYAEREETRRRVAMGLIFYFLAALALIELNSLDLLPVALGRNISLVQGASVFADRVNQRGHVGAALSQMKQGFRRILICSHHLRHCLV